MSPISTFVYGVLLSAVATVQALPSGGLSMADPRHVFARQLPLDPACNAVFGTSSNETFGRNLFAPGDAWLQGFTVPINASLCSLSFSVLPLPSGAAATAAISLYGSDTPQGTIVDGTAIPVLTGDATTAADRLVFTFCGADSIPLVEDDTITLTINLTSVTVPGAPLTLEFQRSDAFGVFLGPSYPGDLNVVNEGLVFNLTTSDTPAICPPAPEVSSSTTTTGTATATSTAVATTTAVVPSTSTTATRTRTRTSTTSSTATPTSVPSCPSRDTAWDTCENAKAYSACIKSPTLNLCYRNGCPPGPRTARYLKRAKEYLNQCKNLEDWARYTHDDEIPQGW